jgi:hypothetical protein
MERQKQLIEKSKSERFKLFKVKEAHTFSQEWYGIYSNDKVIHMADSREFIDTIWSLYEYQNK